MNGPRADAAAPNGKPAMAQAATPTAADRPDHPPKPRFALAIGIVGHRLRHWDDEKKATDGRPLRTEQLQKIAGDIQLALKAVKSAAIQAYRDHESLFDDTPDAKRRAPELTLVSTLADGADTIAAKAALHLGYALDVPLPFALADYEKDFSSVAVDGHIPLQEFRTLVGQARSVLQLPGQRRTETDSKQQGNLKENRAYEAAGTHRAQSGRHSARDLGWRGVARPWRHRGDGGRGGTATDSNHSCRCKRRSRAANSRPRRRALRCGGRRRRLDPGRARNGPGKTRRRLGAASGRGTQ